MQGKKSSPPAGAAPTGGGRGRGGKKTAAADKAQDKKLAALEEALQRAKEQVLRALADAENTRKRADKAQAEAHKYGAAALATDILSVADNLRRALDACASASSSASSSKDASLPSLLEGVRATERELQEVFRRHHIQPIDPKGAIFDPNLHEALYEIESGAHAPGTVLEVAECGYRLQDRLLRPARVGVAKAPSKAAEADSKPPAAEPKES